MADHRFLLIISMPCGEHGGESGDLFLAPPTFARLFKLAPVPDDFERAFAIDFFLESPQGTVHWFAFFKFNLCQFTHFLSRDGWCCMADPAGCSIAPHYVLLHFEVKPFGTFQDSSSRPFAVQGRCSGGNVSSMCSRSVFHGVAFDAAEPKIHRRRPPMVISTKALNGR